MAFEDIAQKLARATITPSPAAGLIGEPGRTVGEIAARELQPFREAEKREIITGEFAKSPIRLQLAKQTGVKRWADISDAFEKARNAYLNWVPGKVERVPKTETIATDFNREFLAAMAPGQEEVVEGMKVRRNRAGGYAFQLPGQEAWTSSRLGLNRNITDKFGKQIKTERAIPGEFEEKQVSPTGKTREQLKKEMDEIGQLYNRIVPGKSDLEAYLSKFRIQIAGRAGKAPLDKLALEKYRQQESHIGRIKSGDKGAIADLQRQLGEIPFSSIQGYYVNYLRDINNNLVPGAIKMGKASQVENSTLNAFRLLNEELVDGYMNNYQRSINEDIARINKMSEAEKLIASYGLLLKIAPMAGKPSRAVVGAVGRQMLMETLIKSGVDPATFFEDGVLSMPRYQDDHNNMLEIVLKEKSKQFRTPIEKKGEKLFDQNLDMIRKNVPAARLPKLNPIFFRRGVTTENIQEIIRKNLLEDWNLAKLAPRTPEAWANPSDTNKKWMALFESVYGRRPVFSDTKKIKSPQEVTAEEFKKVGELGRMFP
jgi:hypothetical protein